MTCSHCNVLISGLTRVRLIFSVLLLQIQSISKPFDSSMNTQAANAQAYQDYQALSSKCVVARQICKGCLLVLLRADSNQQKPARARPRELKYWYVPAHHWLGPPSALAWHTHDPWDPMSASWHDISDRQGWKGSQLQGSSDLSWIVLQCNPFPLMIQCYVIYTDTTSTPPLQNLVWALFVLGFRMEAYIFMGGGISWCAQGSLQAGKAKMARRGKSMKCLEMISDDSTGIWPKN